MNREHPRNAIPYDLIIAFLIFLACLIYSMSDQAGSLTVLVKFP